MAGDWHETLAALIADNATLAWDLLAIGEAKAMPVCTDPWHRAAPASGDVPPDDENSECTGAWTRAESIGAPIHAERRTDRTVELAFAEGENLVVIGEVQSEWSETKRYRLPGYVAKAFQDHQKQVELVILCKTDALAERFRQGIWMGVRSVVMPVAVGPGDLTPITDPSASDRSVELAVATVVMRGAADLHDAPEQLIATLNAKLDTIDPERAADYVFYLTRLVSDEFTDLMEEAMDTEPRTWHNAYFTRVREDGRQTGLEQGRQTGLEQGRQTGREEGRLEQARKTLEILIDGLGIPVSDAGRERIRSCDDLGRLETWTAKVVHIRDCRELLEEP